MEKNLYKILGISSVANIDQIKVAYRKLSKKHHPDTGGERAEFDQVKKAYDTLSNIESRAIYDEFGIDPDLISAATYTAQVIFTEALKNDPADISTEMRKVYNNMQLELLNQVSNIQVHKLKALEIQRRINKTPAYDFIGSVLQEEIDTLGREREQANHTQKLNEIAMAMLQSYTFNETSRIYDLNPPSYADMSADGPSSYADESADGE